MSYRTLRAKSVSNFFVAKIVLIELAQQNTRYDFYGGTKGLSKVGEALRCILEEKEGSRGTLFGKGISTPQMWTLNFVSAAFHWSTKCFWKHKKPEVDSYYKRCTVESCTVPLWTSIDALFFSTSIFNACVCKCMYSLSKTQELAIIIAIRPRAFI